MLISLKTSLFGPNKRDCTGHFSRPYQRRTTEHRYHTALGETSGVSREGFRGGARYGTKLETLRLVNFERLPCNRLAQINLAVNDSNINPRKITMKL